MATTKSNGFNFGEVEAAKENNFLKPGVYTMKITDVALGAYPKKGTKYLGITFTTEEGLALTEKMTYDSEKSREVFMSRLQYLHEAWTNKKLDKIFKSAEEIESYFKKAFVNPKAGSKNILIGGEIDGNNVWARLPFAGFIVPADSDLEVGEFEENDENWKKNVRKSNKKSEASGQRGSILNGSDDDEDEDKGKGKGKVKAEAEAEEKDDLPW